MFRKTFHVPWQVVLGITLLWLLLMFALLRERLPISSEEIVWGRVANEEYNFSIEYPSKWTVDTFGDAGSRGATDIKLMVQEPTLRGTFRIAIYWRSYHQAALEDVENWGASRIMQINERLSSRGEQSLQEIELWEDSIEGRPIVRRRYGNERVMYEDIYIARNDDMFIISLQSETSEFESYLDDFNRVVDSFEPLE